MKTHLAAAALALISMTAPSLAAKTDVWKVTEGPNGSTKGVWTVTFDEGHVSGQAQMMTPSNQPLGYKFEGTARHKVFSFTRTVSSDNQICTYTGKLSDNRTLILGQVTCGDAYAPWVAMPSLGALGHMRTESNNTNN